MTTYFRSQAKSGLNQFNSSRNLTSSIFVGNISYATSEQELRSFFEKACGTVRTVTLVCDNQTCQSRGFGFVQFDTSAAYEKALTMNGHALAGRYLKISPNQSKINGSSRSVMMNATESVDSTLGNEQKTRVVHCKKANYDVYVGRPSVWGNPFVIGRDGDKADRIRKYRAWIMGQPELVARAKQELRGRVIACWCKPEACHGDILAEIADAD
jgi:RNA recognition motif-containing protein